MQPTSSSSHVPPPPPPPPPGGDSYTATQTASRCRPATSPRAPPSTLTGYEAKWTSSYTTTCEWTASGRDTRKGVLPVALGNNNDNNDI